MENLDLIDKVCADLEEFNLKKPILYFAFVAPGQNLFDALHMVLDDQDDPENSLKLACALMPPFIADGSYAVFIHKQGCDFYQYFKTIRLRRPYFDLSCDSE